MILEVKNLSFDYPNGIRALEDISFVLRRAENLGIIGGNGAGKSTLLFALDGLFPQKSLKGEINSDAKDIGLVFQNPDDQIIGSTVEDDVGFSLLRMHLDKDEVQRRVGEILPKVHLSGFEKRSSFELSFGEKKRLSIASVLIGQPEIIMFDEPSLGLDSRQRRQIIDILKSIKNTLIVATYDLDLVSSLTETVMVIEKGRVLTIGRTDEVLADSDLLKSCGMQL